jgi:hypothetical protein
VITTPNGSNTATIFRTFSGELTSGVEVSAFAIGHPSRYASRREWRDVITASSAAVNRLNVGVLK